MVQGSSPWGGTTLTKVPDIMGTPGVADRAGVIEGSQPAVGQRWSPRHVGLAALSLITVQIVFRWWAVLEGFFFEDDFPNIYQAAKLPLSLDRLTTGVAGHLKPGGYLLIWLVQTLAPMNFTVVACLLIALQVGASITVWLLIRELVGPRVGALVPLAVYLFSPLTLGGFLWYAVSIETVMMQLVMAGCLLFHLRYLRAGRRADAVTSLVILAVGLANWEKVLLVVAVVWLTTIAWHGSGRWFTRVANVWNQHRRLWTAHLLLVTGYVALYLTRVGFKLGGKGATSTPGIAWESVTKSIVPSLFGGPYRALSTGVSGGPNLSPPTYLLFVGLMVLVVASSLIVYRGAWRAWLLLATYLALDIMLLASGRGELGVWLGRNPRFFADASVVAAVALAMAVLSPERRDRARTDRRLLDRPIVAGLIVVAYATSCAVTSFAIVRAWSQTSAQGYVQAAQSDLRALGDVVIYDDQPPTGILEPWFLGDAMVSRVIGALPEQPRFNEPTDTLFVVDATGHLQFAQLDVVAESPPGPEPDCGWAVRGTNPVTVALSGTPFAWEWGVKISYFSGTTAAATITIEDRAVPVVFKVGLNDVWIVHVGSANYLTITTAGSGHTVCVTQVSVGHIY